MPNRERESGSEIPPNEIALVDGTLTDGVGKTYRIVGVGFDARTDKEKGQWSCIAELSNDDACTIGMDLIYSYAPKPEVRH